MEGTDDSQIRSAPAAPATVVAGMPVGLHVWSCPIKTVPARGLGMVLDVKL